MNDFNAAAIPWTGGEYEGYEVVRSGALLALKYSLFLCSLSAKEELERLESTEPHLSNSQAPPGKY